jgi:DNA primase
LRNEKTPSFKINRRINKWFDHGLGKGGNLIDFAILFNNCTVGEFLQLLNGNVSLQKPVIHQNEESMTQQKLTVLGDYMLDSFGLLNYLQERRIPIDIAHLFCREVRYELNSKVYYGIGFKNDSGGYEIRNRYFKGSSSPKNITTIDNKAKEVVVFEGFFDFFSFMAIHQNQEQVNMDFMILNSVSMFQRARPFMENHDTIRLYLDRDSTGQNFSQKALSLGNKYIDESRLYKGYKDINDWLVNMGKHKPASDM